MTARMDAEVHPPFLIGVAGDACSGKTSFAVGLAQVLGADRVTVVSSDAYRRYTRAERREAALSRLHPDVYFPDILAQHIRLLKQGEAVLSPTYNRASGGFDRCVYLAPREFVIVEGLLAYGAATLQNFFDVKIYLAPDEALRQRWKLDRDVRGRKRSDAEVRAEIAHWESDAEAFVRPQRNWSDMVIRLREPGEKGGESALSLTLRPTLPRPDLQDIWRFGDSSAALRLELDRDLGLPVDRVEVNPGAADAEYLRCEKALWDCIRNQQAAARRAVPRQAPAGGMLMAADGSTKQLRGLALAQLLTAAHIVAGSSLSL